MSRNEDKRRRVCFRIVGYFTTIGQAVRLKQKDRRDIFIVGEAIRRSCGMRETRHKETSLRQRGARLGGASGGKSVKSDNVTRVGGRASSAQKPRIGRIYISVRKDRVRAVGFFNARTNITEARAFDMIEVVKAILIMQKNLLKYEVVSAFSHLTWASSSSDPRPTGDPVHEL
ncbi:hypothetical protein DFH07DRAFT_780868 [Mycena maculata]|uniref:Uncharacterized protein n=1 Tax=Mycena maculata TaxID=230809 RepID=A0AAD7I1C0_9AGAR|nr:hypothetical protein DFH07DRAFT_780868 [Mycena maculata]